jgi:hypothetical protein
VCRQERGTLCLLTVCARHSCLPGTAGSGALERGELASLLKDFLGSGRVTAADVSYFEAMLELDDNNAISEQEFLAVAKVRVWGLLGSEPRVCMALCRSLQPVLSGEESGEVQEASNYDPGRQVYMFTQHHHLSLSQTLQSCTSPFAGLCGSGASCSVRRSCGGGALCAAGDVTRAGR